MPAGRTFAARIRAVGAAAAIFSAAAPATAAESAPIVVELFTSQGCSSCPPADELLGRLAKQPGIVALSHHVDYWNYLGWADPFSSKAATYRQRDYAMAMRQSGVYTPQIVINGRRGEVGSHTRAIDAAIAEARAKPLAAIVTLEKLPGRKVRIAIEASNSAQTGDVWLVLYDKQHATKILRGENSGKTLTYHHVVREMRPAGRYSGAKMELAVSAAGERGEPRGFAAVLLQQGKGGPLLAAAAIALDE